MIEKNWKYYLGLTFLALSFILPLFGILIPFLNLPVAVKTVLVGGLTIGGPEIMVALAVICLGEKTLHYYKMKIFKLFKRKTPPKPVSKIRYNIGLVILIASLIPLYLNADAPHLLPPSDNLRHFVLASADLVFVISFFILGGNFWEKFKSLFIWDPPEKVSEKKT